MIKLVALALVLSGLPHVHGVFQSQLVCGQGEICQREPDSVCADSVNINAHRGQHYVVIKRRSICHKCGNFWHEAVEVAKNLQCVLSCEREVHAAAHRVVREQCRLFSAKPTFSECGGKIGDSLSFWCQMGTEILRYAH